MNDLTPADAPKSNQDMLFTIVQTITESQAKEVEVKKQELEIRSQEIASNERIAMKSIEAQERSHVDSRVQYNKHLIHRYAYIITTLLVICAFTIVMVMNGGKEIIIEAFKMVLAAATGAFGGFHAGKNKKPSPDE